MVAGEGAESGPICLFWRSGVGKRRRNEVVACGRNRSTNQCLSEEDCVLRKWRGIELRRMRHFDSLTSAKTSKAQSTLRQSRSWFNLEAVSGNYSSQILLNSATSHLMKKTTSLRHMTSHMTKCH